MNFRILYEFLEIFIDKEKMKKGKPWNSTGPLSAQGHGLRGLAAHGRLQA
jgi:hypothetical protein